MQDQHIDSAAGATGMLKAKIKGLAVRWNEPRPSYFLRKTLVLLNQFLFFSNLHSVYVHLHGIQQEATVD